MSHDCIYLQLLSGMSSYVSSASKTIADTIGDINPISWLYEEESHRPKRLRSNRQNLRKKVKALRAQQVQQTPVHVYPTHTYIQKANTVTETLVHVQPAVTETVVQQKPAVTRTMVRRKPAITRTVVQEPEVVTKTVVAQAAPSYVSYHHAAPISGYVEVHRQHEEKGKGKEEEQSWGNKFLKKIKWF